MLYDFGPHRRTLKERVHVQRSVQYLLTDEIQNLNKTLTRVYLAESHQQGAAVVVVPAVVVADVAVSTRLVDRVV